MAGRQTGAREKSSTRRGKTTILRGVSYARVAA
jgi:hypothetical protein